MATRNDDVILKFMASFEEFLIREDYIIAALHIRKGEWHCALRKNGSHVHSVHGFGSGMLTALNNAMRRANGQEPQDAIGQ